MPAAVKTFLGGPLFYWVPACVVAYAWLFLAGELSHVLSRWNLFVFAPGILVVIPAFFMPLSRASAIVLLSGLFFDASLPVPYEKMNAAFGVVPVENALFGEMALNVPSMLGFGATWMLIAFFALRFLRRRIDLASPKQWLRCALAVNFSIYFFWALVLAREHFLSLDYWLGFFLCGLVSAGFLVLLGWWFFDATLSAYRIFGVDLTAKKTPTAEDEEEDEEENDAP